jgi:hypothetical protein
MSSVGQGIASSRRLTADGHGACQRVDERSKPALDPIPYPQPPNGAYCTGDCPPASEVKALEAAACPGAQENLVRSRRLELPRGYPHKHLKLARLPFRHDRTEVEGARV